MIDVQNLTFAYPNQPSLFESFNWSLAPGETWSVVGRSGCGKSTLLCLLYPIPKIIFLPIVLLSLGIGNAPKVFIIALALFFSESFATTSGLGYYIIVETWGRLAYDQMYAGVVAMSLLGLGLYMVVDRLDERYSPWQSQG